MRWAIETGTRCFKFDFCEFPDLPIYIEKRENAKFVDLP